MAISFEIKITGIKRKKVVPAAELNLESDLADVISHVRYDMTGTKEGHSYNFPCEFIVPLPKSVEDFIALSSISEEVVMSWIENDPSNDGYKQHIEIYLDKMITPPEEETYFEDWLPETIVEAGEAQDDPVPTSISEEGGD
ncbi:MAG: hypothetical protein CMI60_22200 [Parvibaculum sp.]|nr:hypothetical protein [Parvibaculum sp.]